MRTVTIGLLFLALSIVFSIGVITCALLIERTARIPFFVFLPETPTLSDLEISAWLITLYNLMTILFWATLLIAIVLLAIGASQQTRKRRSDQHIAGEM